MRRVLLIAAALLLLGGVPAATGAPPPWVGDYSITFEGQRLLFHSVQQRDRFIEDARGQDTVFYLPKPAYPHKAKLQRASGQCIVRMTFLRLGLVERVQVVKSTGWKILDDSARQGALKWRLVHHAGFFPVTKLVPITFVID